MSGLLYGECRTTLAPHREPYSREVFHNRAIVADIYTLGTGMSTHEIGLPVLRGDGSMFLSWSLTLAEIFGLGGIPINSDTPPA